MEARQTMLFAFKAFGALLLVRGGGGEEVRDRRANHAVMEARPDTAVCI